MELSRSPLRTNALTCGFVSYVRSSGIRVAEHPTRHAPWQRGGNESSGSSRISGVTRGDDDGTKVQVSGGFRLQQDVPGNGLAMFQVRVSLWTWGFKSPLAHKLVEGSSTPNSTESPKRPRRPTGAFFDLRATTTRSRATTPCRGGPAATRMCGTRPGGNVRTRRPWNRWDRRVSILASVVRHTGPISSQQIGDARRAKRPPEIPDDVADPAVVKATGRVTLPARVRWSAPARSYDLADRRQRARVYEQVLIEGVEQDVREIIDVDEVVGLWDELYLPDHVRRAWADWLAERRGVELPC